MNTRDITTAGNHRVLGESQQASEPTNTQEPIRQFESTDDFAKRFGVKGSSVRHRVCITGTYFGAKPRKLPNGRLDWSSVRIGIGD